MSLTYGFFNSYNGDRVYDAEQFSSFLDGIIYDGVYNAIGNKFYVTPGSGMSVQVDSGRAWFDHTWTYNSSLYSISLSAADTVYARIDAIVLEVNKTDRKNYLKVVKGTASASPIRPTLTKTSTKIQHALAYVNIPANATSISQSNITNVVDTAETPLVSALALSGIPSGGTIGQVLAKKSSESGAVGWYDADKLPYDKWYLANGITEANVLGAYKFINNTSSANVLKNVNQGTSYPLVISDTSKVSWSSNTGFTIQPFAGLNNSSIWNASPVSVVAKFSNANSGKPILLSEMNNGRVLYIRTPYTTGSFLFNNSNTLGFNYAFTSGNYTQRKISTINETSGIVGATFTASGGTLFNNKSQLAVSNIADMSSIFPSGNVGYLIGMRTGTGTSTNGGSNSWTWNPFSIQYIAFYSSSIDLAQFTQICNQITSDAG